MSDDPNLLDPNQPNPMLDPNAFDLKGKSKSKLPLVVVGAIAVVGIGVLVWRMAATRSSRKEHAAFMERFQSLESDDLAPFWNCLLGNMPVASFGDNLAIGAKIESSFNQDPKAFPDKVLDDCVPKLKGVASKVGELNAPSDYSEPLAAYAKSIPPLGDGIKEWAEHAKTRIPEREADLAVEKAGAAFHSVAGKAPPEAIAYVKFLRCAVPDLDKLKDEQALLEKLFVSCKSTDFVQKMRTDCAKVASATDGKEDKAFKDALKKLGADDRDTAAVSSCFKKGRKAGKRDDMEGFGRAFVAWKEAGAGVLKVGQAHLKEE